MKRAVPLVAVMMLASTAHAGPWTPEPGHGYVKLWAKYLLGVGYFAGDGGVDNYANYHELFLATYGDVGLVDGLALWWHSDLVRTFYLEDPRDDTLNAQVAPGDPAIGLRWRFYLGDRLALSLSAGVRAPLADDAPKGTVYERNAGDDGVFDVVGDLRVGSGVWSVPIQVDIGYAFDTWYVSGSVSYTVLAGGYDDRIGFTAEVGAPLRPKWTGRLRLSGVFSLRDGSAPRTESPSGYANGTSYMGIALELDYEWIPEWFLGVTLEGGAGYLRRQTGGPVISLSLSHTY